MAILPYKEMTLEAIEKIIYKYRHPEGEEFQMHDGCPLCEMYFLNTALPSCHGCFLKDDTRGCGCVHSKTFRLLVQLPETQKEFEACKNRAKFHEHWLPYLVQIPAKYFTPEYWENFDKFMPENWRNWTPDETD